MLAVVVAVETTQPTPPEGVRADDRPIIGSLTAWDGTYYLGIAEDGYHAEVDDVPRLRLLPGATRSPCAPPSLLTGGRCRRWPRSSPRTLAFFAGTRRALRALGPPPASRERPCCSLWFLSLAPGAIAFTLSYSESLFLLLAAWRFPGGIETRTAVAGRHRCSPLATLTRVPGILLRLPLLVLYIERDGWRPTRAWMPLFLAPLALARASTATCGG